MPLQKQPININFGKGLDLKTDPFQVEIGNFLALQNTIFTKGGLLQKRNGFGSLPSLPNNSSLYATTFNGNLTTIGTSFEAFSDAAGLWVNKGFIQPLELSTLPLIRSNTNQSQCDSAVSPSGLVCTVYTDQDITNTANPVYKYSISDSITGQNIVAPTPIPVSSGVVSGSPRVFQNGRYFIIVITNLISGTYHLQYVAVSISNPTIITSNVNISSIYTPSTTVNFDGFVANSNLYLAWNGSDGSVKVTLLDGVLLLHNTVSFAGQIATLMSVTADVTGTLPQVYVTFYDAGTQNGYVLSVDSNLNTIFTPKHFILPGTLALNITSAAKQGFCTMYVEFSNNYSYDSSIPSHFVSLRQVSSSGGLLFPGIVSRSVGLASKAFIVDDVEYVLAVYQSDFQSTYFLLRGIGAQSAFGIGDVIAKIAYSNAGGYLTLGLPGIALSGNTASIAYLFKDGIQAVNKNTNVPAGSQVDGIYSQLGINLVTFTIGTSNISSTEIASTLNITGGFMWSYDGYSPVENGFFVWPDSIEVTTVIGAGNITAQQYFYQVTYEWADNNGNVNRSAPSIPVTITTTTSSSTNTINVPTLRLTYKISNPVKIVIYRWSVAQQTYYQVTSITSPLMNDTAVDQLSFDDTLSDAEILGNNIIYTNGGVIENISPPACSALTLFDDRLFLLDSEDGTVWYSKQVLAGTPVEMSDLFTIYVAPTIGASGSTGNVKCIFPMDDKLIFFKKDAIYYMNGSGPDNTGANSQYSQPIFITATVGSINQQSIVFTPNGLMFQSDKGIWLLGRNLQTQYIGAPVETFNDANIESSLTVPATNQVRFTLDNGKTLMYDYYYGQWGTFVGIPAISSTLYQGLHTYIDSFGQVFQETPGSYLDGSRPVLISFTTSWIHLAGLQGYQRAYYLYLLGSYLSPHKLSVQIAYDYAPFPSQQSVITPNNYNPAYGSASPYGAGSPYGGAPTLEQWKVHLRRQTCESFQITVTEYFDYFYKTTAGQGLTLSGINAVVGIKKGYFPIRGNSV